MTLVELLNEVPMPSSLEGLTFLKHDAEGDVDPDSARGAVSEYIGNRLRDLSRVDDHGEYFSDDDHEKIEQLCNYGSALYETIDTFRDLCTMTE